MPRNKIRGRGSQTVDRIQSAVVKAIGRQNIETMQAGAANATAPLQTITDFLARTPTLLGSLLRAEQGVGQLQERAVHEVAKQLGVDERVVGAAAIAAEAALSGGAASARRLSSRAALRQSQAVSRASRLTPSPSHVRQGQIPSIPEVKPEYGYRDTRGGGQQFHGAANEFELAPGGAYSDQNIYGNGLYTTDDVKTAAAYRRKNKGKGSQSEGVIYEVPQRGDVRLYDLDQPASAEVKQLVRNQSDYYEDFLDDVFDEVGENASLAQIMDEMRASSRSYDIPTYEVTELFDDIAEGLKRQGYGGYTHQGGRLTRNPRKHKVKIYWDADEKVSLNRVDQRDYQQQTPESKRDQRIRDELVRRSNSQAPALDPPIQPVRPVTTPVPAGTTRQSRGQGTGNRILRGKQRAAERRARSERGAIGDSYPKTEQGSIDALADAKRNNASVQFDGDRQRIVPSGRVGAASDR